MVKMIQNGTVDFIITKIMEDDKIENNEKNTLNFFVIIINLILKKSFKNQNKEITNKYIKILDRIKKNLINNLPLDLIYQDLAGELDGE